MKESEAMEKLAEAMSKLADRLERIQDPVVWQKLISDAIQSMPRSDAVELKKIAEKLAAGETLKLKQKPGCIFVSAGDEDIYLPL